MVKKYDGPSPAEKLVDSLVELMEAGQAPWRREWSGGSGGTAPINLATGHRYRGSNVALLVLQQYIRGSSLPLWIGRSQARERGWMPRKGSKGAYIIRPQMNQYDKLDDGGRPIIGADGSPEVAAWMSFKPVCVFNAADLQGDGLAEAIAAVTGTGERPEAERIARAESVLGAWPVPVTFGGDKAFYTPSADRIAVPALAAFDTAEAHYATWAHEAVHSTGHKDRLCRDLYNPFGSDGYAREELVAELGAVMLCQRLEIGSDMGNHAAYLQHWARILRSGPKVLYRILSEARKAADLICPEPEAEG
jgi:antirestriction protein ArdC